MWTVKSGEFLLEAEEGWSRGKPEKFKTWKGQTVASTEDKRAMGQEIQAISRSWEWTLANSQQGNGSLSPTIWNWILPTTWINQKADSSKASPERDTELPTSWFQSCGTLNRRLSQAYQDSNQYNCEIINRSCFKSMNL